MEMHEPPHPGEILQEMYLEPRNVSITELAERAGISANELQSFVDGKTGITIDMAGRLANVVETSPDFWLNMQQTWAAFYGKAETR